jgi:hypothetical protein
VLPHDARLALVLRRLLDTLHVLAHGLPDHLRPVLRSWSLRRQAIQTLQRLVINRDRK